MSQHQRYWIARISDRAVLEAMDRLGKIRKGIATVESVGGSLRIEVPTKAGVSPEWDELHVLDSFAVQRCEISLPGYHFQFFRGGQRAFQNNNADYPANAHFDEVVISNANDAPDELTRIRSLAAISQIFKYVQFDPEAPDPAAHLAAIQETRLDRLEQLNRDLIEAGLDYRKKVDKEVDAKHAKLEDDHKAKAALLQAEHDKRNAGLEERELQLAEEKKRIDDSDNTTARRKIRDRMLDDVKSRTEQFGVSRATVAKRRPVQLAMLGAISLLGLLTLYTTIDIDSVESMISKSTSVSLALDGAATPSRSVTSDLSSVQLAVAASKSASFPPASDSSRTRSAITTTNLDSLIAQRWALWVRLSLLSLALGGTILYYIRWENSWAQRHADAEFNLQQFHVDVNRANWIIESCLEWKKSTASDIPPELLASISRGLFSSSDKETSQVVHPADQLASALFGTASKVRLKSGDSEVELDAKKVPKEAKV